MSTLIADDVVPTDAPIPPTRRRRAPVKTVLLFVLMVLIAIVMLYPFYFMVDTSLKSNDQFLHGGGHSLDSWTSLSKALPWGQQMVNSAIVAVASILIILFVSSLAGFAFAKLQFRMSGFAVLYAINQLLRMFHPQAHGEWFALQWHVKSV